MAASSLSPSSLYKRKWLILLYWWVRQYPVTDAAEEAKVEPNTAVAVYQWLREVCSSKLIQTRIQLGGYRIIVQINESLLCRSMNPYSNINTKYVKELANKLSIFKYNARNTRGNGDKEALYSEGSQQCCC